LNILAIDTATESLSLCLRNNDERLSFYSTNLGLQHASRLMPAIDYLLTTNDLTITDIDMIVCSIGPGSFTGLRIGLATAKGLAVGRACPVIGISTLEAMAYPFRFSSAVVVPVIDAKKNQIYAALFQNGKRLCADSDLPAITLLNQLKAHRQILLTGPMALSFYHQCLILPDTIVQCDPHYMVNKTLALIELGLIHYSEQGGDTDGLCPVYIRKSEAELSL